MASQNCKYSDDETKELQQSIQLSKHVGWANIQAYTWESPMPAELEWEAPGYPKPIASRTDYSSEKRSSEYRSQSHSVFFPPSFCTSHSIVSWSTRLTLFKCNINQKANYSNFLTMTTWSLGQCPKPKCLASGSTLHAAPPVHCWAAHSICIYLLSIRCIPCWKHGLDGWWSNSP